MARLSAWRSSRRCRDRSYGGRQVRAGRGFGAKHRRAMPRSFPLVPPRRVRCHSAMSRLSLAESAGSATSATRGGMCASEPWDRVYAVTGRLLSMLEHGGSTAGGFSAGCARHPCSESDGSSAANRCWMLAPPNLISPATTGRTGAAKPDWRRRHRFSHSHRCAVTRLADGRDKVARR